jgi:hypothetical protein
MNQQGGRVSQRHRRGQKELRDHHGDGDLTPADGLWLDENCHKRISLHPPQIQTVAGCREAKLLRIV